MKVADILMDADLYVPNSIDDTVKLRWLNEAQKQLYRDFSSPDVLHTFQTMVGVSEYDMPADCQKDRVSRLNVDTYEYDYRSPEEDDGDKTWTFVDGKITLYPVPDRIQTVELFYKPGPPEILITQTDTEPYLPRDFHEVLVFAVAYRIATAMHQFDVSDRMRERMLSLQEEAKRKVRKNNRNKVIKKRLWR